MIVDDLGCLRSRGVEEMYGGRRWGRREARRGRCHLPRIRIIVQGMHWGTPDRDA